MQFQGECRDSKQAAELTPDQRKPTSNIWAAGEQGKFLRHDVGTQRALFVHYNSSPEEKVPTLNTFNLGPARVFFTTLNHKPKQPYNGFQVSDEG